MHTLARKDIIFICICICHLGHLNKDGIISVCVMPPEGAKTSKSGFLCCKTFVGCVNNLCQWKYVL